ncbi:MAG: nodulation protein NfeD [Candidatus Zixiibacteriota bacterium]|nr:MAG: nodulation protein NfeD [candidate division Zixibacteria bacterium]
MSFRLFAVALALLLTVVPAALTDTTAVDSSREAEEEEAAEPSLVLILTIDGAIGTVTADMVIDAVEQAEEEFADLLVIQMDTPGGFTGSLWPITKAIMNSTVPVVVYIAPPGAKAASAGVYITYAAHVAVMAPSTNIGAAHVVGAGGEQIDSVLSEKVMNDAVASLRAMADRHGRNGDWAEEAARKSVSITNTEALEKNVINFIAEDLDDLFKKIEGCEVNTVLGKKVIELNNPVTETIKKTLIQSILDIISSPNIVFMLLSIGGLGIVLELYNPGAILPGVVGGICLILAFYGMRTLPINYAGVLLILFAIILFLLEIKIVSHGLLTIGGVVSIIIGGMMLIDTADPELKISKTVIYSVAIVLGAFVLLAFTLAYKARVSKPTTGKEGLVGEKAVVRTKIAGTGYVYLAGELWEASADEVIEEGEEVIVVEVDSLKMKVKRIT